MQLQIALFGNPNSGRTSLFNLLTGATNAAGNWSGATTEILHGSFRYRGNRFIVWDMPGIYALSNLSPAELPLRHFLERQGPEMLVVNVVDSLHLERNLYLTTQLIETGVPLIVALNMTDALHRQGAYIDAASLSQTLGAPCIEISALSGWGVERLLAAILELASQRRHSQRFAGVSVRHIKNLATSAKTPAQRYRQIEKTVVQTLRRPSDTEKKQIGIQLDAILCHRLWALPLFIAVICSLFYLAFGPLGAWLQNGFQLIFSQWLPAVTRQLLLQCGVAESITRLLVEGAIAGVGAILTFLPQLVILFLGLALLEHSGYMARIAFITDKLLAGFGLSGKAFIPMVLGFGCSVPAVIACASLDDKGERTAAMLAVPFISCSARMPVYVLLSGIFFPNAQELVVISLYLLGIAAALLTSLCLKPVLRQTNKPPFLMEIPPYRKPTWRNLWQTVWQKIWDYIQQAGTVIFLASITVWFLDNFNWQGQAVDSAHSILASLGTFIAPFLAPLGFGSWQIAVALLSGFFTKDAVVSSLAVLYAGLSAENLSSAISQSLSPAAAYALMVFVLLYTPCVATISAIRKCSGCRTVAWSAALYQLALAWIAAFCVYRLAMLFL